MKKKLLSMLLALGLTASLFAGCGAQEEGSNPPAQGGDSQEPGGADGDAAADDGETAEIKVGLMCFSPLDQKIQDRIENVINEKMVEAINVKADFMWFDAPTYEKQIPMMIQGGEQLDVIMYTPIPVAGYAAFMAQSQLMDITEQIEAYGADIKKVLGDTGLAATSKAGKIYGVGGNMCRQGGEGIIVRKDALEAANMVEKFEKATTWTEIAEVLTAIKDAGKGVVINCDTEGTCITPGPYIAGSDKLSEAYWVDTVGDSHGLVYVDQADGKVKSYIGNPDYLKNLMRAGEWYDKGLIYKDASNATEYADQQIKNGVGTMMVKTLDFGWSGSLPAGCGGEVAVKFTGASNMTGTAAFTKFGYAVPVTAKDPDAAVKFINLLYSENDIHNTLVWGEEGVDWEKAADGTAQYVGGGDSAEYHMNDFLYGNILDVIPWTGSDPDLRAQQAKANAEVENSKYIGFTVDDSVVASQVTACQSVSREYKPMLASGAYGTAQTEAKYQEFVAALEAAGLNDIIAAYQSQLDEWLATK